MFNLHSLDFGWRELNCPSILMFPLSSGNTRLTFFSTKNHDLSTYKINIIFFSGKCLRSLCRDNPNYTLTMSSMNLSHDQSIISWTPCHSQYHGYTLSLWAVSICHSWQLTATWKWTYLSLVSLWAMWIMLMQDGENNDIRDILLTWEHRYTLFAHDHVSVAKVKEVCIMMLLVHSAQLHHCRILMAVLN